MSNGESTFDYRDEAHPRESWDQFLVRKLREQHENTPEQPIGEHLGGHLDKVHMDRGAFMFLKDVVGPEMGIEKVESFIDVGCATGAMVKLALDRGLQAIGVDGDYEVAKEHAPILIHDFCESKIDLDWYFDIGWSVEFVEHVEEEYMDNWLTIFERCRMVAITYAPPGWPGHHHVNCQDQDYWVEKFGSAGLTYDEETTKRMRQASTMRKPFMQHRGLFFFNERDI